MVKKHQALIGKTGSGKSVAARELAKKYLEDGKHVLYVDASLKYYRTEHIPLNKGLEILFSNHPLLSVRTDKEFLDSIETFLSPDSHEKVIIIDHMACSPDRRLLKEVIHDCLQKDLDNSISFVVVTQKPYPIVVDHCEITLIKHGVA